MIVSLHVATGAAAGALLRTRMRALLAGPLLHLLGDMTPHQDIASRRFEIASGLELIALLAVRRGFASPEVVGALSASAPDIEHVLRLPRPRGRKLFPTHRNRSLHRSGGLPAWLQLLVAGALVGLLISRHRTADQLSGSRAAEPVADRMISVSTPPRLRP
jgi:hypothetical protein